MAYELLNGSQGVVGDVSQIGATSPVDVSQIQPALDNINIDTTKLKQDIDNASQVANQSISSLYNNTVLGTNVNIARNTGYNQTQQMSNNASVSGFTNQISSSVAGIYNQAITAYINRMESVYSTAGDLLSIQGDYMVNSAFNDLSMQELELQNQAFEAEKQYTNKSLDNQIKIAELELQATKNSIAKANASSSSSSSSSSGGYSGYSSSGGSSFSFADLFTNSSENNNNNNNNNNNKNDNGVNVEYTNNNKVGWLGGKPIHNHKPVEKK